MSNPDSIDEKLALLLGEDGRQSSETLAKKLKVSSATVRRRLRILIHSGALKLIALVDPTKFGFPVTVVITLSVTHDKLKVALDFLSDLPETKWVSTTTGRYDIVVLAQFRSNDRLSEFMMKELANVEGLKDSETFICLDIQKGFYVTFSLR